MTISSIIDNIKYRGFGWILGFFVFMILVLATILAQYSSMEPEQFNVQEEALKSSQKTNIRIVPNGYVYSNTLAILITTLLDKNGGYLSNDVAPPSVFLDNMPSWEFGALVMVRDGASALRNHFARSQSQSSEDPDLAKAEPYFYYEHTSWALPSTEGEYRKGNRALKRYMHRLLNTRAQNRAQFYSRADNLRQYFEVVEKRLGGLSARLIASTGRLQPTNINERYATMMQTSWIKIDDVFWEARGATWALVHLLKAVEHDFGNVLADKNATETMQRVIHELEKAITPIWSPMILNGDGFGILSNYSLTMATYITRANAATLDLRDIMMRG
ncbi:MAG TPA: DUF2333 family protein [Methylococcaceae bacterium]|nr:DUF2333 family protein [Methylococcaceae bacterium]HIA45512.1 DUF2333 family protein [Methylococcaceae bacterium]HIB62903.1 DUF2333 family protein [Methylococcaceae bacterium]HIN67830.1 DUF2333 family protein [Methylococcales bacterium]HIO44301.1 DUF2333 family protein [Methylococcales bacterium]